MILSKYISFSFSISHAGSVLRKISFEVAPGNVLAIVGPSGCGKTTLIRILSGYLKPSDGTVFLDGVAPNPNMHKIGIKYQDNRLLPWRNILDNISLPHEIQRRPLMQNKLMELMTRFRLGDHAKKYPSQLSGGQQERTALARALVSSPKYLFLDEPLGSTDYVHRLEIEDYIYDFVHQENVCCVLITHDLEQAIAMADEIMILGLSSSVHPIRTLNVPAILRQTKPSAARMLAEAPVFLKTLLEAYSEVILSKKECAI